MISATSNSSRRSNNDAVSTRSSRRLKRSSSSSLSLSTVTATPSTSTRKPKVGRLTTSPPRPRRRSSSSTLIKYEALSLDKPTISYASIIVQALVSSPGARSTLPDIYEWVEQSYPYYRRVSAKSWQTSIRQCLAGNAHFIKLSSGDLWTVNAHSLAHFETKLVVPQGTFNMLQSYITKLIQEGPDRVPAPYAENWPIRLGPSKQLFQFAPSSSSNASVPPPPPSLENDSQRRLSRSPPLLSSSSHGDSFILPEISPRQFHQGMQSLPLEDLLLDKLWCGSNTSTRDQILHHPLRSVPLPKVTTVCDEELWSGHSVLLFDDVQCCDPTSAFL